MPTPSCFPASIASLSLVPTPSLAATSSGSSYPAAFRSKNPPNPPSSALAPGRADLLHLQAQVSSRLGDRSAALAAFNAALQLDPSLVRVWYELGALEEERENWAAARSAYERALDLLPTYSAAALALADLLGRRDSPRAAIGVLIRLLETDPWELEALTARRPAGPGRGR